MLPLYYLHQMLPYKCCAYKIPVGESLRKKLFIEWAISGHIFKKEIYISAQKVPFLT